MAYADDTEVPDAEAVSALDGVEVGWIAVLPVPDSLGSWLVFERIDHCVVAPDARIGDNIHDPIQLSGS